MLLRRVPTDTRNMHASYPCEYHLAVSLCVPEFIWLYGCAFLRTRAILSLRLLQRLCHLNVPARCPSFPSAVGWANGGPVRQAAHGTA